MNDTLLYQIVVFAMAVTLALVCLLVNLKVPGYTTVRFVTFVQMIVMLIVATVVLSEVLDTLWTGV